MNDIYNTLLEILEAASCITPGTGADALLDGIMRVPDCMWIHPAFKETSGRTNQMAVIVLLDIVRRYLTINVPGESEAALHLDPRYYSQDFRLPESKTLAALCVLQMNGLIEMTKGASGIMVRPNAGALATVMLSKKEFSFFMRWEHMNAEAD